LLFRICLLNETGWLNENTFSLWFIVGVSAIGIGSKLITEDILKAGGYDLLYFKMKEVYNHINIARA
jgi:2-keto-3-deoxy-6-phosphogluconate aldolase